MIEQWDIKDCHPYLSNPGLTANKYRRGVLACITGGRRYPGAALMTTAAALATGVGMVRYFGPKSVGKAVIQFRPSVVLSNGKFDAVLIGSGIYLNIFAKLRMSKFVKSSTPKVVDAGAIPYFLESNRVKFNIGPTVITPHAGELAKLLRIESTKIEAEPIYYAKFTAQKFKVTVLLKGHQTVVANSNRVIQLPGASSWLATAGTGDVLAGILGALLAINHGSVTEGNLIELSASASLIHAMAAKSASAGPIDIETMIKAVPKVVAEISSNY